MSAWIRQNYGTAIVVVAALVIGLFVWRDRGAVTTDEKEQRKGELFASWRAEELTRVELTSRGRSAVVTRAPAVDGGEAAWTVTIAGQAYPADAQAVEEYLGRLGVASFARRVSGVDRAAAGLDAPRVAVDVQMGARRQRLAIGGPAPTPAGASYAEVPDRGVFAVTAQLVAALDIDVDSLRTRSFLPFAPTDLESLELTDGGGAVRLVRAPWGGDRGAGFRFAPSTPEGPVRADAAAVDRILLALGHLQAERHLGPDEAARAAHPEVTLRLASRDPAQKPAVIELGGACPAPDGGEASEAVVAVRKEPTPAAACVAKDVLEALATKKDELLDRHAIGAPLDEITEIAITSGERRLEMARSGTAWHLRAPADRAVAADVGRGVVQAMLAVKGELTKSELGPVTSRAQVRVRALDPSRPDDAGAGERVETVELVADAKGALFVRRGEDGATLAVAADAARDLVPGELALRSHRVLDEPNKRFRGLRVERGSEVQVLARTTGGGWSLTAPKGRGIGADSGLASNLVEAVGHLAAERWIAEKDDGSFGLDKPRIVVEAKLGDEDGDASADRTVRIELGAPTNGGSFARIEGDGAVFVAPRALEAAASRWLLDRTVFMVEPSQVSRVTLEQGKRKLVVERAGDVWKVPGAPSAEASAHAADVRDAVSDLLAEGAVSLGAPEKGQGFDTPTLTLVIERAGGPPARLTIGAGDAFRGTSAYYVRRDGVDATYAIAQSKIRPLLDALQ